MVAVVKCMNHLCFYLLFFSAFIVKYRFKASGMHEKPIKYPRFIEREEKLLDFLFG